MANTKLPSRLLDTSAIPALNVTGDLTVDTNILKVDSTNDRVGIGIASPAHKLHVQNASGTTFVRTEVAAGSLVGFNIKKTGSTTQEWNIVDGATVNGRLQIQDVTDNRVDMTFDGTGKVGIGTASPAQKLHVGGTSRFDDTTYFAARGLISWGSLAGGTGFGIRAESGNGLSLGSNGAWDKLVIDTAGEVGIGTTNPGSKLHVNGGHIRAENTGTDAYFFEGIRNGSQTTLRIYDNSNNLYIDSHTSMNFRANQTGGGSGGNFSFGGGNVAITNLLGVNKAVNSSVGLSVGSDAASATSYGLEICNNNSNTRFLVDGLGSQRFYGSDSAETARFTDGKLGIGTPAPIASLEVRGANENQDNTDSDYATGAEEPILMLRGANGASVSEWIHSSKAVAPSGGTQTAMISWYRFDMPGGWSGTGTPGFLEIHNQMSGMHASGSACEKFYLSLPNEHGNISTAGGLQNTSISRYYSYTANVGAYTTSISTVFYYGNSSSFGYAAGAIFMKVTHASREPFFTMYAKYIGGTGASRNYPQKMHFLGTEVTNNHAPSNISSLSIHDGRGML